MYEVIDHRLIDNGVKTGIQTLEQGLIEHNKWVNDWHRSMLCGLPIDEVYLLKDGYRHCNFGKWYYNQYSQYFGNNKDFLLINKLHRSMHAIARVLSLKAKLGDKITKEEYDVFYENERKLSQLLHKLKDELRGNISKIDFLTGVPIRQPFFKTLSHELSRSLRTSQPCFIAMVDLDNLKNINDKYGHLSGDKVLKSTAQYLSNNLRPYDSMCRYGGDEFLICLPHTTQEIAKRILSRLQLGLDSLSIELDKGKSINITASFGAASMVSDTSINDIIARADEALYAAKGKGRDQISFWEDKA